MEIVIYSIIGMAVGALAVYLIFSRKMHALLNRQTELSATLKHDQADLQQAREALKELHQENKQLAATREANQREIELLKQQTEQEAELRNEQFRQQLSTVREQLVNITSRMLNTATDQLNAKNSASMQALTAPISESFEKLQSMIADTNEKRASQTSTLYEQLKRMSQQTEQMEHTAMKLTNALKGDSKQAGDWGELILNELLDSQGFRRGIDYDVQSTVTNADGTALLNDDTQKRMRPDVILHYPDNQDVIIDAKVSIRAYYDYVNETNDALKKQYLDRHVLSVRQHVRELASKDYSKYVVSPRKAIDFVIMYVPNEGALQAVLLHEPRLWQDAFEQKVFITSTQNLFAILRMIQIAWRHHRQTENQKRIVALAEQLLSRVGLFTERVQRISRDIDTLRHDYDDMTKSINGRMGITQKAQELKQLGVREDAKHPLPEVDEALPPE